MNISVLGCGWLGLPLAKSLLEDGHRIKGSTTTMDQMARLTNEGIIPYLIKVFEEGVQGDMASFLSDSEILIIDIPPGTKKEPEVNFVAKIGRLHEFIEKSAVEHVIFISSTSVYEDTEDFPKYNEDNPTNGTASNAVQLRGAENLLDRGENYTLTIIRFGGLYGPGRHPVQYLSGRKDIANPEAPVNLIHLEDGIGVIRAVINNQAWEENFNAIFPEHPTKKNYYTRIALEKHLPIPEFDHNGISKGKIISSSRLNKVLNYKFVKNLWE